MFVVIVHVVVQREEEGKGKEGFEKREKTRSERRHERERSACPRVPTQTIQKISKKGSPLARSIIAAVNKTPERTYLSNYDGSGADNHDLIQIRSLFAVLSVVPGPERALLGGGRSRRNDSFIAVVTAALAMMMMIMMMRRSDRMPPREDGRRPER